MTAVRILGDWGTTRLRLFRTRSNGTTDRLEGAGFGAIDEQPLAALFNLVGQWGAGPFRITLCGMAGARGGVAEAPYVQCPVDQKDWRQQIVQLSHGQSTIMISAGLRCADRDVMRGEETQIFGALALHPVLQSGVRTLVLPGTHSKWVTVCDGVITQFKTYFTGELYALLQSRSTLLKAATPAGTDQDQHDGWIAGSAAAGQSQGILGSLFEARVAQLLCGRNASWATGFLSGLLIGSEINEGLRLFQPAADVVLIGSSTLANRYASRLAARNVNAQMIDGDSAVIAGLELIDG